MRSLFATFVLGVIPAACGGGGGGGGGSPPPPPAPFTVLSGVWLGQSVELEAPPLGATGGGDRVQLVIDATGFISSILLDGQPSGTGQIGSVPGQSDIFSYTLSSGGEGGFYLGGGGSYAAVLDVDGTIAVLQRGASSLPTYTISDVVGSWSGQSVFVDQGYEYVSRVGSQVAVNSGGTFAGGGGGEVFSSTAPLTYYTSQVDPSRVYWFAEYNSNLTADGIGRFIMSPDKQFLTGFAGANGGFFPEDFSFPVWFRQ